MHQPSYIAHGETVNNASIVIAEPTPFSKLTALLDKINENKIVFQDPITVPAIAGSARLSIMHLNRYPRADTAFIEVFNDKAPVLLSQLPNQAITAIINRLKLVYASKLNSK